MENTEDKQVKLLKFYNLTRLAGVVNSQKEFCTFIGINPNTMSKALKGNTLYLTDNLLSRVEHVLKDKGISIATDTPVIITGSNNATATGDNSNAQVTTDTAELIAELKEQRIMFSKQIEAQMDIIKNLTQALSRK